MVKISTHKIEVSVSVMYWQQSSSPKDNHYFFVYFISIKNNSNYSVQLLKRHWDIFDSGSDKRVVEGDGVVGETPILEPGESFEYYSGCNLSSEIGYMKGFYTFNRLLNNTEFEVEIPKFDLIVPSKLN